MVSDPVVEDFVEEVELLADLACFVVIFMVVSYGVITVGKTVPLKILVHVYVPEVHKFDTQIL